VKPSGPGALSDGNCEMASFISFSSKGLSKCDKSTLGKLRAGQLMSHTFTRGGHEGGEVALND
jgi:hypothetical protein